MPRIFFSLLLLGALLGAVLSAPVDPHKKKDEENNENKVDNKEELDDYGLEYGRYLQQVIQALEEDKEFAKKLENVTAEDVKSGNIAKQLEFVNHKVRNKLDELKRMELERLRKLARQERERNDLGLYRDQNGHLAPIPPDGRRWRTIPKSRWGTDDGDDDDDDDDGFGDPWLGIDRKNIKMPQHLNLRNPSTFEVDDLMHLIKAATRDLEKLDQQRREEFKKYEMEKEHQYREKLKHMSEEERKKEEAKHEELQKKHKDHPKIHHPGSKPQLEQVWEEQDHLPKEEFDPKTFFAMHDVNGDGYLDEQEVEAILSLEIKKMYDPNNEEDDPVEMMEEYNRMREHIYRETDTNKDGLISKKEFDDMVKRADFEKDEGWKGLDEQTVYTDEEFREYERQLAMQQGLHYPPPPGMQPEMGQHPYQNVPHHMQQGSPQQAYQGGNHQQAYYQGGSPHAQQAMPQQQPYHQGVPPHSQQGMPQQQYQGVQPHSQQGVPQHNQQGVPVPSHYQQGIPVQQHMGVPQGQYQGVPIQQQQQYARAPSEQPQHEQHPDQIGAGRLPQPHQPVPPTGSTGQSSSNIPVQQGANIQTQVPQQQVPVQQQSKPHS